MTDTHKTFLIFKGHMKKMFSNKIQNGLKSVLDLHSLGGQFRDSFWGFGLPP